MACMVRNLSPTAYPLPLAWGGQALQSDDWVVVNDSPSSIAAALGNPSAQQISITPGSPDGLAGSITPSSGAAQVTYIAAVPGQWAGSPPAYDKAAIDRLAAAVFALRTSAPIP